MRPGEKVFIASGSDWGVRVIQPAAMPADWWDPDGSIEDDNPGIQMWPLRAINTPGTPWGGGPEVYADTLVSLRDPLPTPGGLLIEGNGIVPWAEPTGWGFVAAAAQWFDTGLVPTNTWSVLIQFANQVNVNGYLFGIWNGLAGPPASLFAINPRTGAGTVVYWNEGQRAMVPVLATGNLGIAGPEGFRNGVSEGAIPAGPALPATSIFIGALNNMGVPALHTTADVESLVVYDATPTAPQVLAVATAMAAL